MLRFALLMLVLVPFLLSSPAAAQSGRTPSAAQVARARAAFDEGSDHYAHGRYREAMDAFERAYRAVRSPEFLYNIYTAAQQAGDLPAAEEALSTYLASSSVPPDERPALETRLSLLRQQIAEVEAEQAAQAAHLAEAERRARAAERVAARTAPRVSPAATAAFVVGAGGLASFITFATLAAREDRRVGRACGVEVGALCSESEVRRLRAYNITADISLGVGAIGAATGLIVFFVQRKRRADLLGDSPEQTGPDTSVHVAPLLGGPAGTWGLVADGTF